MHSYPAGKDIGLIIFLFILTSDDCIIPRNKHLASVVALKIQLASSRAFLELRQLKLAMIRKSCY